MNGRHKPLHAARAQEAQGRYAVGYVTEDKVIPLTQERVDGQLHVIGRCRAHRRLVGSGRRNEGKGKWVLPGRGL
jgi:hypothetical protein